MRKLIPINKNKDTYLTKVKYPLQQNINTPIEEKFKDNKYNVIWLDFGFNIGNEFSF